MSLTSTSASITRFRVFGELAKPPEAVLSGLEKFNIDRPMDENDAEERFGWTNTETPYSPEFEGRMTIGSFFVFSLRVDKKTVPGKLVQQKFNEALRRKMEEREGRALSKTETREIKSQVKEMLVASAPFVPNIYDLFWDYETATVYLLSTSKSVCEKMEDIFRQSFGLRLVQLFPFTVADLTFDLDESQRKNLHALQPTYFTE